MHGIGKHSGYSMVEVLVTVVVLSIGLLGIGGLQLASLKHTHGAYVRSQASALAGDILERMRLNRPAVENGAYDSVTLEEDPDAPACVTASEGCSPGELATADIAAWKAGLAAALPSGNGTVQRTGEVFAVTVQWRARDDRTGRLTINGAP